MTDADTPRVPDLPDFRWHPTEGLLTIAASGVWNIADFDGWPNPDGPRHWHTVPADAVKLGDVEAARREADEYWRRLCEHASRGRDEARRERDALKLNVAALRAEVEERHQRMASMQENHETLRADIRAVLDDYDANGMPDDQLARIDLILDREPGREEPKPRVFLPGDTIPARVAVLDNFGDTQRRPTTWSIGFGTAVEIPLPSQDEWNAAVESAKAERFADDPAHGQVVEHQPEDE